MELRRRAVVRGAEERRRFEFLDTAPHGPEATAVLRTVRAKLPRIRTREELGALAKIVESS